MSLSARTQDDQDRVDAVYASDDPGAFITHRLYIDGEDITDLSMEVSSGRSGEEEPGQVLTAKIAKPMSRRSRALDCEWDILVDGVPFRRFTGKVLLAKWGQGTTELTAVTGGFWNGKVQLRGDSKRIEYVNEPPTDVVYDAILRNRGYDHAFTELEPIQNPKITLAGESGFSWIDKVSDPLQAVEAQIPMLQVDNFRNGFSCRKDLGAARLPLTGTRLFVGTDIDADDFGWTPSEEQYSGVMAYRELEDGTIDVRAKVELVDSPAPPGVYYEIELGPEMGDDAAYQQVYDVSEKIAGGIFDGSYPVEHVRATVEDGDGILIVQPDIDGNDVVIRYWSAEVLTQNPAFPQGTHNMSCRMVITHEEVQKPPKVEQNPISRIKTIPMLLAGDERTIESFGDLTIEQIGSGSDVPGAAPLYGLDAYGNHYADESLGWVYVDANGNLEASPGASITLVNGTYNFGDV